MSKRAARLAPEYEIDYRTPVFAIYKERPLWEDCWKKLLGHEGISSEEFWKLPLKVRILSRS